MTKREIRTILAAIQSAIMNEAEFIRCHTPEYERPSHESKRVVARTKRFIAAMKKVSKKLAEQLREGKCE